MRVSLSVLTALCLSLASEVEAYGLKPGKKILLSKVDSLTLRNDQMTKGRRVEPIPQVCVECAGAPGPLIDR